MNPVKEAPGSAIYTHNELWLEVAAIDGRLLWRLSRRVPNLKRFPTIWAVEGPTHAVEGDPYRELSRLREDPLAWLLTQQL